MTTHNWLTCGNGWHHLYDALPERLGMLVDKVLHPLGIHGWSCRGRQDHIPITGRWI